MSTPDRAVTFTGSAVDVLKDIVEDWISEGFTTPPYRPEVYDIIDALGVTTSSNYDIRRPAALFEERYAERSGVTVDVLREHQKVVPCDCNEEGCEGWGMVSLDSDTCGECGHYDFHHRSDGSCHCGCSAFTKERRWPRPGLSSVTDSDHLGLRADEREYLSDTIRCSRCGHLEVLHPASSDAGARHGDTRCLICNCPYDENGWLPGRVVMPNVLYIDGDEPGAEGVGRE